MVDGRTFVHIALAAEVEVESTMDMGGGFQLTQNMTGSSTGLLLWDTERGLFASGHTSHEMEGTASMGAVGTFGNKVTVSSHFRLEN